MGFRIFRPLQALIAGAPLAPMLCVILLLGLVPAAVLGVYYVQSNLTQIEVAEREREGVEILRELRPVEHILTGYTKDSPIAPNDAKVALKELRSALDHGAHTSSLQLQPFATPLLGKLMILAAGKQADPRQSYQNLVTQIGDQSGLILDPELDSYYLMDIVLMKSRKLAQASAELAAVNGTNDTASEGL